MTKAYHFPRAAGAGWGSAREVSYKSFITKPRHFAAFNPVVPFLGGYPPKTPPKLPPFFRSYIMP